MRRVVIVAGICAFAIAGCAHPKPAATPPAPNLQPRLDAADALLRAGCFDCLAEALREYDAVRAATGVPAALAEAATLGAIRASILLDLRGRELGFTNDGYLAQARARLRGRDDLAASFSTAIDLAESIAWKMSPGRDVSDDAQLSAQRRLSQNREAWKELFRGSAGQDEFSAYLWLTVACAIGETRLLTPDELAAPFAPLREASLLAYKSASCPGTRGKPDRSMAVDTDALAELLKREPRFVEINSQLATFATLGGELERADELLLLAYRWHAKWPSVTMALASVSMAAEDFERALGFYDATLALVPGERSAMLGRVKTLSFVGRHEEAIQAVDKILEDRWNRGEAYYWRAWNNMQLARNDQAWDDVEHAWKLYINSDVAKLAGMIAYRRQQLDVSREKFEQGTKMNPGDCELGYYLGLVNAEQRRWPPTAEVFVTTATCLQNYQKDLTGEIARIQASKAGAERKARQIAKREKMIRDAERMIATSWFNTAVAYFNLARKAEARQYAEKVTDDVQFGERAKEIMAWLAK